MRFFPKGYNIAAEALCGLMHLTGEREGQPMRSGIALTDILASLHAYAGITTALYEREKDPKKKGQLVKWHKMI